MRWLKIMLFCIPVLALSGEAAFAKCSASMPRQDWHNNRIPSGTQFSCRNESCGGSIYHVRFGDNRLRIRKLPPGMKPEVMAVPNAKSQLKLDGMTGTRVEFRQGGLFAISEIYMDVGQSRSRVMELYSAGTSKAVVRRNLALLRTSLKCR